MKMPLVHSILTLTFSTALSAIVPCAFAAKPSLQKMFPEGERLVYTRLVSAYRSGKLSEVKRQKMALKRNYPNSIHLDNAYLMSGMLQFQSGSYGEALRDFQVVRKEYPQSNKRPSALFATAMTYEKLNLAAQAREVLQSLITEYPGSPESLRAAMQLKLLPSVQSVKPVR